MRRTLQTTSLALDWLIQSGVPVRLDARWQENSDKPCDTGSEISVIREEFTFFDFSVVDPVYPDKSDDTPYAYTKTANLARGDACLRDLYARPEQAIAVVSHAGFLRTAISKCRFANADYRVFGFRKGDAGQLELHEDVSTESMGGGMGRSLKGLFHIEQNDFPLEKIEEIEEGAD